MKTSIQLTITRMTTPIIRSDFEFLSIVVDAPGHVES